MRGAMLVGLIVGLKEKAGVKTPPNLLDSLMSRDGLEPSTHWLKASCSHVSACHTPPTLPPPKAHIFRAYRHLPAFCRFTVIHLFNSMLH